jgi:poly(beta-D-mannuronate) lyase
LGSPNAVDKVTSTEIVDQLNAANPVQATVVGETRSVRSALKPGTQRRYALRHRNAAGASPLSAPLDLPAAAPKPDPKPGTVNYPADIVGKNFYLTMPVKDPVDGWAMEIEQPTLATYDSKYFLLTDDHTGAVFRVWHGGATTSGSKNPRSELREQTLDGKAHAAWASKVGRHRMVVKIRVNRLTKVRPHVVIGQIHDAADDVSVFRVEGSNLWITAGDSPHGYLLDGSFALGRDYEIGFDVSGGVISYLYNGKVVPYTLTADFSGAYFKTGAYLQSNPTSAPGESTDEFAEVVIYSVAVTHS